MGCNAGNAKIKSWISSNKIFLNEPKTVEFLFTLKPNDYRSPDSVKFLGVHLDPKMTWEAHCIALCKKLSTLVYLLRSLSSRVSENVLLVCYHGCFQSHLSYALMAWGHSSHLQSVFKLRRRAVRVVAGLRYRADCRDAFTRLKIMTLPSLYIDQCLLYVHDHLQEFQAASSVHDYSTRSATKLDLYVTRCRLETSKNSSNYWCVKLYNCLPSSLRVQKARAFKSSIKTLLLKKAYYNLVEAIEGDLSLNVV